MNTIATHNGTQAHQAHNFRDPRCVEKEPHIDPNGEHETWKHEPVKDAYHRIFDEAQEKYNEKQKREDRKIEDYYTKIANDKQKHPCYEMIVGIYGNNDPKTEKEILREFVNTWNDRNPTLELIGAYYHNDEKGGAHVHLDYIPIIKDCSRGMEVQTGLNGALKEMGFYTSGTSHTAQMHWERAENEYLERLCRNRGIEIEHPQRNNPEKAHHRATQQFKAFKRDQEIDRYIKEVEKREKEVKSREKDLERREKDLEKKEREIKEREEKHKTYEKEVEKYCKEQEISKSQYFWTCYNNPQNLPSPERLNPMREESQEREQERDLEKER